MFNYILNIFRSRSNLDIALDMINKSDSIKFANMGLKPNFSKQQLFMVGKYDYSLGLDFKYNKFLFGKNDEKCVIRNKQGDLLFLFIDEDEIKDLRKAIITKCEA